MILTKKRISQRKSSRGGNLDKKTHFMIKVNFKIITPIYQLNLKKMYAIHWKDISPV